MNDKPTHEMVTEETHPVLAQWCSFAQARLAATSSQTAVKAFQHTYGAGAFAAFSALAAVVVKHGVQGRATVPIEELFAAIDKVKADLELLDDYQTVLSGHPAGHS